MVGVGWYPQPGPEAIEFTLMPGLRLRQVRYPDDEDAEPEDERPIIPFEDLDPATQAEVLKTRRVIKLVGWLAVGSIVLMIVLTIVAVLTLNGR